jgi:hypothetical protein
MIHCVKNWRTQKSGEIRNLKTRREIRDHTFLQVVGEAGIDLNNSYDFCDAFVYSSHDIENSRSSPERRYLGKLHYGFAVSLNAPHD